MACLLVWQSWNNFGVLEVNGYQLLSCFCVENVNVLLSKQFHGGKLFCFMEGLVAERPPIFVGQNIFFKVSFLSSRLLWKVALVGRRWKLKVLMPVSKNIYHLLPANMSLMHLIINKCWVVPGWMGGFVMLLLCRSKTLKFGFKQVVRVHISAAKR